MVRVAHILGEYLMCFLGFDSSLSLSMSLSLSLSLSLFISLPLLPCSSCFPLSHSPSLRLMPQGAWSRPREARPKTTLA